MNFFRSLKRKNLLEFGLIGIVVICIGFSFHADAEEGKMRKSLLCSADWSGP